MKYLISLVAVCALLVGAAAAQQYPQQQQQYPAQQYPQSTPAYPQTSNSQAVTIPAGTQLQIRTDENITADQNSVGKVYAAEIANDLMDPNGRVIAAKGSPAQLTIADVTASNAGVGSHQVALALQSITVNGRTMNVQSNQQTVSGDRGIGKNKRTGEMVGGGAVLGTVIGAVAGGAKGAIIGAIAGAGAGGAAQVLTRGSEVKVPAETVLTFKLDQPVSLY
ncbi:MAG: hypothetical protein ACR2IF_15950 [Terriglobales bacterium]